MLEIFKEKISYSKILKIDYFNNFIEITVDKWGDIATYRVYKNGEIYEK